MSFIQGFGGYIPTQILSNDDLSAYLDTSDEWITTRTGIKNRRIASPDQSTADLAMAAAEMALEDAGIDGSDLGEIIVATDTPEVYLPDTAAFIQERIDAGNIPAYDLGGSGCAGAVLALDIARSRIKASSKNILVIGVEVISRIIPRSERRTAVLFGDAAGAMVLSDKPKGKAKLLEVVSGTDGSQTGILTVETGGTKYPFDENMTLEKRKQHLVMNGPEVFKHAVRRMSNAARDVLEKIGRTIADVALVIPHQANRRIIDAVSHRLGILKNKVYVNVHEYGNTGSASVPFALWEATQKQQIKPGDLVILTSFGAGFHWSAAAIQF